MVAGADTDSGPVLTKSVKKTIPELVKTKSYPVVEIIRVAYGDINNTITDEKILEVQVLPIGDAKGFAYYDGRTTWKLKYNLERPEDLDNDPEQNCWKVVGGMSEKEKISEFDPMEEGGAAPGSSGTGEIDIKVFYKNHWGGVSIEVFRARVVLKKLIVEVDWMEGYVPTRVAKDDTRDIGFKPNINQEFIDAFGQVGIEVVVKDTPEKGNLHNIIPKDAIFDGDLLLNRENLAELLPPRYKNWREDIKLFNDSISYIAKVIIANGYMDFDASRPDVIYVIGAQRWAHLPGKELEQTRGATTIFQHRRRRYNIAFVFNLAIAESMAAVNKQQEIKVTFEKASLHTVLHECAAHCFPLRWKNKSSKLCNDPYWSEWRYQFVGHRKRNDLHKHGKIYETCVTCSESTLDAAYHTWLGEPRLGDFSNLIGNGVDEKCRDIIRDYIVKGDAKEYGRIINYTENEVAAKRHAPLATKNK